MGLLLTDTIAAVDARKWSFLARVPDAIGSPFGVYCFGATTLATLRNRGVGRRANPLTGAPVSVAAGSARVRGAANVLRLAPNLTGASWGIAMIAKAVNLPTAAPGGTADHVGYFGNFGTSPQRGVRAMMQTYIAGGPTVDISLSTTVNNAGSPVAATNLIQNVPSPTGWKALAFSVRAGTDRSIFNFTDALFDVDAETRTPLVNAQPIYLGSTTETPNAHQALDICNCIVVDGTGWSQSVAEQVITWLRADAATVGITA